MLDSRYRERGFTLVEMVLVVSILGIIVSIATATYVFAVANSRSIACQSNQRILTDAAYVYAADKGSPPDDIDDLEGYVRGNGFNPRCASDPSIELEWDSVSEQVTCDLHPTD